MPNKFFPSVYTLLRRKCPRHLKYTYKHFLLIVENMGCQKELIQSFKRRYEDCFTEHNEYDVLCLFFTNETNCENGFINRIMIWSHDSKRKRYEYVNALLLEQLLNSLFDDKISLISFYDRFLIWHDTHNPLRNTSIAKLDEEQLITIQEYCKLNYKTIIQRIKNKVTPTEILIELSKLIDNAKN